MQARYWVAVAFLFVLMPQPLLATTVISRDDARQCYLATLSDPSPTADKRGLDACDRAIASEDIDTYLHAALLVNRSDIRLGMQDYRGALADADASIALEPDLATAHLNRGAGLIGLKRYQDALVALERAIALNTGEKLQMAFFNRGLARDYLGDLQGAYFDYQKAVEIDPNFAPAKAQLTRFTVTPRAN